MMQICFLHISGSLDLGSSLLSLDGLKICHNGVGEMTQQLRALVAFLVQVLAPIWRLTTPVPQDPMPFDYAGNQAYI